MIPYVVGIWEEYLRSSFIVLLKYTDSKDKILKNARFSVDELRSISKGTISVEEALVSTYSFQRPQIIADNFKALDDKIDLYTTFKKRYNNRKVALFDSIDEIIDLRNAFVHSGWMDKSMDDDKIKRILDDFEAIVQRIYIRFAEYYNFTPAKNF